MRKLFIIFLILGSIFFAGCSQSSPAKVPSTFVVAPKVLNAVVKIQNFWQVKPRVYKKTVNKPCGKAQTCPETDLVYTGGGTMLVLASPVEGEGSTVYFDSRIQLFNQVKAGDDVCIEFTKTKNDISISQLLMKTEPDYLKVCGKQ